jgi:capsid protein
MLQWYVGDGLELHCQPNLAVLQAEGVDITEKDIEQFNKEVEARYMLYQQSRDGDNSNEDTAARVEHNVFKNAYCGGDVLVLHRYEDDTVTTQLVDASHVHSQVYGDDYYAMELPNGNQVRCGVELDRRGRHVAYYVRNRNNINDQLFTYERIPAYNSQGFRTAYLVYGDQYRLNNYRGMPLCASVIQTLKQLDRFKTATIGKAEESAKVVFQIKHDKDSTGENPMNKQLAKGFAFNGTGYGPGADLPVDANGKNLANLVSVAVGKEVYNMPNGAEIAAVSGGEEQALFKDFYSTYFNSICGALDIPPNVGINLYQDSFSASRAALEMWIRIIIQKRARNASQFNQRRYELWLHTEILKGNVDAPGYLTAFYTGNKQVLQAYRTAVWDGPYPGHIDPKKEADAIRSLMGGRAVNMPLMTYEAAVRRATGADSIAVIQQYDRELKDSIARGISDPNDGMKPQDDIKDTPAKGEE